MSAVRRERPPQQRDQFLKDCRVDLCDPGVDQPEQFFIVNQQQPAAAKKPLKPPGRLRRSSRKRSSPFSSSPSRPRSGAVVKSTRATGPSNSFDGYRPLIRSRRS